MDRMGMENRVGFSNLVTPPHSTVSSEHEQD